MSTDDPDVLTRPTSTGPVPMSTEPRFEKSLTLAKSGDGTGFDDLYLRVAGRIKGFAISRQAGDPDGITSDVVLKMFQNIADFSGDESDFAAWGFAIARNQLIDAHRAAKRRPSSTDQEIPDTATRSAEAEAFDKLGNERVQLLLQSLTEDQRDVITMRIIADLSLEQTAYAMDKPVSAVKRLQARALKRLRKEISEEVVS